MISDQKTCFLPVAGMELSSTKKAGILVLVMLSPFSHLFGTTHSGFQAGDSPNYFIIGFVLCIVAFAFSDGIMLPCSFVLITQSLI